jgi:hypothetical protein
VSLASAHACQSVSPKQAVDASSDHRGRSATRSGSEAGPADRLAVGRWALRVPPLCCGTGPIAHARRPRLDRAWLGAKGRRPACAGRAGGVAGRDLQQGLHDEPNHLRQLAALGEKGKLALARRFKTEFVFHRPGTGSSRIRSLRAQELRGSSNAHRPRMLLNTLQVNQASRAGPGRLPEGSGKARLAGLLRRGDHRVAELASDGRVQLDRRTQARQTPTWLASRRHRDRSASEQFQRLEIDAAWGRSRSTSFHNPSARPWSLKRPSLLRYRRMGNVPDPSELRWVHRGIVDQCAGPRAPAETRRMIAALWWRSGPDSPAVRYFGEPLRRLSASRRAQQAGKT